MAFHLVIVAVLLLAHDVSSSKRWGSDSLELSDYVETRAGNPAAPSAHAYSWDDRQLTRQRTEDLVEWAESRETGIKKTANDKMSTAFIDQG